MPDDGAPPSTAAGLYDRGSRGGGGKLRRERKPPLTPYDRPQPPRRWISRLVDPAKRLISSGATLLLPSLFSTPSPTLDEVPIDLEHDNRDCNQDISAPDVVTQSPAAGVSNAAKVKSKLEITHEDEPDTTKDHSEGSQPDIEQLIHRKTFSSDEVARLMEIMRSRIVDAEQERKPSSLTGTEEIERAQTSNEKQKTSVFQKEETDRFLLVSSTPPRQAIMQEDIGASPVDIARAYMGSRVSGTGLTSTSLVWKNQNLELASEHSSKPVIPSPRPKAAICWPGAITQSQQDFSTPRTQKSRFGIHSLPRTPYSRPMYNRSKSKLTPLQSDSERLLNVSSTPSQQTENTYQKLTPLQGNSERLLNVSSTPLQQTEYRYQKLTPLQSNSERLLNVSSTPLHQTENRYQKSVSYAAQGSYGSGGAIRRTRNRLTSASPAWESVYARSVQRSPFSKESTAGFMPKGNYEPGSSSTSIFEPLNNKATNSEAGVAGVHPHSSKLARQILEQIDRPVTLKERSKELNMASSFKNSHDVAVGNPVQSISSIGVTGMGMSRSIDVNGAKLYAQENHGIPALSQHKTDTADRNFGKTSDKSAGSDEHSAGFQKSELRSKSPEQATNNIEPKRSFFAGDQNKAADATNYSIGFEQQNAQRKPSLPSITINKPGLVNPFSSDTSAGFSFHATSSSTLFPDLPTPSVIPTFLTGAAKQSDTSGNPHMTAGKITIAPPVISLPYTSAASDSVAPEFKFGSGKARLSFAIEDDSATSSPNSGPSVKYKFGSGKSRLNFGSIGSDAVCC